MDLNPENLTKTFIKAGQQVFFDMLATSVEVQDCFYVFPEDPPEKSQPSTYGVSEELHCIRIDFSGDFYGELFLYFSQELSRSITREFLIMNEVDLDDLDECVDDILGELANMMAGLIKNSFLNTNLECWLGLPQHILNQWITFEDPHAVPFRNICTFPLFDDIFLADLVFYAT